MAELSISFALDQLLPLVRGEVRLLRGVHKGFADTKAELESIQAFIKDADRRAAAEGDSANEGIKIWVKQVREVAFLIEDVIDEYMIYMGLKPQHPGWATSLLKVSYFIKTLKQHHQMASQIRAIKSSVREIKERSDRYGFQTQPCFEQGNFKWHDPRLASLYIDKDEVVGLEGPIDELIGWLVEERIERTVISVVGMGGIGKTTLAKKVFDDKMMIMHFDCYAWILVSQSYTVEGLLRNMLEQFCEKRKEAPPQNISKMDLVSLINEVRNYLEQKRYVIFFDDVWNVHFWSEIRFAAFDNKNGSRILITTRSMDVAEYCKESSFLHVHELQPLPLEKSWELFCKKAFRYEFDGRCPQELMDISYEIVKKCGGLPLAIAAVGGLLSTKEKNAFEMQRLSQNLSAELEMNPRLNSITRILALSFDDLPYYLKSCFLYFGMYPEHYTIYTALLVQQWIAEGFVKYEKMKTLEEVAEQYLAELIRRSLVQVLSYSHFDDKVEICGVHDLFREMIIRKMKDLSFCHFSNKDEHSISSEIIWRLSITTNLKGLMGFIASSHLRSLFIFEWGELSESFVRGVPTQHRLLKVLHFENAPLKFVPENLGNLFHLRYLNLRKTNIRKLPKSIGKLQNLETLDLSQTLVQEMPKEVSKLKKLRHLIAFYRQYEIDSSICWDWQTGFRMKDGIGGLTSLQTLMRLEANHGGVELIEELGKLKQLRVLRLNHVKREYGSTLCLSINKMQHLEILDITAIVEDEVIDLHFISSMPQLRRIRLKGKLEKLPNWDTKLQYLVSLSLLYSKLTDDPLKSLKNMPNLMHLLISYRAYEGESLHFQDGGFQKLQVLSLLYLCSLNSIVIDKGALTVLKEFQIGSTPQLKVVPFGIHHLANLEALGFYDMPHEFEQSIDPNGGQEHWIIKHVPTVYISHRVGPRYYDYDTRIIRH